ncbi:chemotaxis protein CheR [Paenibacillus antarcticus]|uniref:Chemotaxis protein CheR n=1 Tax=Paenibacillus antarcticus TaxID=253703 RepID=A0A168Q9G3_9BACL|nr:chemotaxis protein CheR [Paenibacillus antarcticus]
MSEYNEIDLDNSLTKDEDEREKIEVRLLLEAVFQMYGYDFRNYAFDSIRRRIRHGMHAIGVNNVSALIEQVLHYPQRMHQLLRYLVVNVTEMFRDPSMFRTFREKVVPFLHTYPHIRIWHAGCSTGEEVLSMAILLHEEGLYDKARIYATDIDEDSLEKAQEGIFPLSNMKTYTHNYIQSGGTKSFSDYYTAQYDAVRFDPSLMKNIVFARHNLVTDQSFNEFNVIFCRNVMIYFDKTLKGRVHQLFHESLSMFGFLALGDRESIHFSEFEDSYKTVDLSEKLYQKMK